MLLIPAIDLKDGKCVRLRQGKMEDVTVFGDDPVAVAGRWVEAGARRLHMVDLNGAFEGKPVHFINDLCVEFPGHVIVGLDAKEGKVAIDGWSKLSHHSVIDLAQRFEQDGVEAIVFTDIGRDGMMQGVNVDSTVELAQAIHIPVIASGGITNIDDIRALCEVHEEGIMGAITGRAIYEGTLDLAEAQKLADELCAPQE
jgi:phosphoribosylformimino-5-aminoimidazole carboxamide ribotide isomerase